MPIVSAELFFPSRRSQRLGKEKSFALDVHETRGTPRLTARSVRTAFLNDAAQSQIGLLCHNDPIDNVDPMGLASEQTGDFSSGTHDREWEMSATEAVWNRQMNFSSSFGAISYGMRAYAAEQAFKISVGIEATKRAEKATGKSQVPYSVATMRYRDTHTVAYGDPVAGERTPSGGYEERIDIHHEKFAAFRANPSLWNSGIGWRLFVIGHTHPLLRSQAPGFSDVDRRMQAGQLRQYGEAVSLFKNNPTWPGHVYDARMMGPNGWEVTHWSEGGKLLGGPESD